MAPLGSVKKSTDVSETIRIGSSRSPEMWIGSREFDTTRRSFREWGVEIQVSGRSDLLARDIVHIRNNLQDSHIDVGAIVVPSDDFEYWLTDRVANFSYAVRYVEEELREAKDYPIVLLAIEHDGFTDQALPKKRTNRGKR